MIVVVSLSHDSFQETFDEGKLSLTLERKAGQPKIFGAIYEREVRSAPLTADGLRGRPQVDDFPGVPLSDSVLLDDIKKHKGLKRLEVNFWNVADLRGFRRFYQNLTT